MSDSLFSLSLCAKVDASAESARLGSAAENQNLHLLLLLLPRVRSSFGRLQKYTCRACVYDRARTK